MIKRTLYFGNPAYLSLRQNQLLIKMPDAQGDMPDFGNDDSFSVIKTIPVEDIGIVVLDNSRITITHGLISSILENNGVIVTCDNKHLPSGLMLPLSGNNIQNEKFRRQFEASLPLKKQLWQQTVRQKILNQAAVLAYTTGSIHRNMAVWADAVKSGDSENMEARAASYYWKTVFPFIRGFVRGQYEDSPNSLLNYGYSILRAVVARALVASGMHPSVGIHHHNRYNAYCLADDIMEPYRPYVDRIVFDIVSEHGIEDLNPDSKRILLSIPVIDVVIEGQRRPLMNAVSQTTSSLFKCFDGECRKLSYPVFE